MDRRKFLELLAVTPAVAPALTSKPDVPRCRIVSPYAPAAVPGMPGPFPGRVISVRSAKSVDEQSNRADAEVVREMMARGMLALTGEKTVAQAWRRFFEPADVVGIKVNCGGRPHVVSSPEIVGECVQQLMALGIPATSIFLYERFRDQLDEVNYAPQLPPGVGIVAAESRHSSSDSRSYDPRTYVEVELYGEEDTRSNLMRLVTRQLTKIINIPNVKDHGATGVTGCLKNIAYGSFSNVARTHHRGTSHTLSLVGTFASVEPLRSRTVLQILDGLRGVWHGGPFAFTRRYVFYPKQLMFGTDPVAIDRLLLDIVDEKRKAAGAISIWNRSPEYLKMDDTNARDQDPNVNVLIREPGHVEFAAGLGLGVFERERIALQDITL
jgi:hypothetical protein